MTKLKALSFTFYPLDHKILEMFPIIVYLIKKLKILQLFDVIIL